MPDSDQRARQAVSFGAAAAAYDRGRPSYPDAAVRWCVPETARRVLDLGAGTGKLTQVLVGLGHDVVGVEPLVGMREQFAETLPGVEILAGTGEDIPLPDASVDAVCCGQAWHWVDPDRAAPEVARVLRPGGVLALLWNVRERDGGWAGALDDLLEAADGIQAMDDPVRMAPPFDRPRRQDFHWRQPTTPELVRDMVVSRSYFLTSTPADQQAFLADLQQQVFDRDDMAGQDTVELPYRTECWVYDRPA